MPVNFGERKVEKITEIKLTEEERVFTEVC